MDFSLNELENALNQENEKVKNLSLLEKYEYLLKINKISISTIQRIFNYSFPKASKVINELIEIGAIEKKVNSYVFISKDKYLEYANKKSNDESNYTDPQGSKLINDWIELCEIKFNLLNNNSNESFDTKRFITIIRNTCEYFKQLNNCKSLTMHSPNSISFHSCMLLINLINHYSKNTSIDIECNYNDYNDLKNYPQDKLQLTIKASTLIAEGLSFTLLMLPRQKLSNTIDVIYNSETIEYNIETEDLEKIIKIVSEFPFSEN